MRFLIIFNNFLEKKPNNPPLPSPQFLINGVSEQNRASLTSLNRPQVIPNTTKYRSEHNWTQKNYHTKFNSKNDFMKEPSLSKKNIGLEEYHGFSSSKGYNFRSPLRGFWGGLMFLGCD